MKLVLVLLAVCISVAGFSQQAYIKLKTGEVKEVKIQATSATQLFTTSGTYNYTDIEEVAFKEPNKALEEKLLSKNVRVTTGGVVLVPEPVQPAEQSPILIATKQANDLDQLYTSIERFREQRTNGKVLQLVGVLAIGASIIYAYQVTPANPDIIKGLSIGGAAASAAGFIIDLDAGKHLKRNK